MLLVIPIMLMIVTITATIQNANAVIDQHCHKSIEGCLTKDLKDTVSNILNELTDKSDNK
jgi:hypothetical protein